ncbi:LytR/AlgR family response regulator transcription factor [Pedobacter sp. MR2016-24]|uniref:LytR/AlgR family response regulator transcription factor n=1 Tax=Pedobacter sp. MR2016-24 TaxID=2994466 RepID=UPI0022475DD7|nr:LytTR family DNA-binding domain-containing protein [Pedobacter sp. MR2016-24]MCX2485904.1 LytTR family DNA-binding domain-containing protein [Pedobacter sp. MR2016-24]
MKNILKCVIIDDEQHAVDLLTDYISELPSLSLYKTYINPILALDDIKAEDDIDIIWLDIDMPGISGLELAKSLRHKTKKLIFTTAHTQYAVEAFEVKADNYLLKPIKLSRFVSLVSELTETLSQPEVVKSNFFFIKGDEKGKLIRLDMDSIIMIEGLKNYIVIYTKTERFTTYLTMLEAETALLNDGKFMRIHKSFIVNSDEIKKVNGSTVYLTNDIEIMLGTSYKERFYDYLNENTIKTGRR